MNLAWTQVRTFADRKPVAGAMSQRRTGPALPPDVLDDISALIAILRDDCEGEKVLIQIHDDTPEPRTLGCSAELQDDIAVILDAAIHAGDALAQQGAGREPRAWVNVTLRHLTAIIPVGTAVCSVILSSPIGGTFPALASERLERRIPLLHLLLKQWLASGKLARWNERLTCAIEHCDLATIILGKDAQIRFANATAATLLEEGDGIRQVGERLDCANLSDSLRLISALTNLNKKEGHDCGTAPVLQIPRHGRRSLLVTASHLAGDDEAAPAGAASVIYIIDPEQDLADMIEPACALYGLTPSETRLACALVDGASIKEAAGDLRLQEHTARSYLKHIFQKTDTKRQAELVQLILRSAIRVCSPLRKRAFR